MNTGPTAIERFDMQMYDKYVTGEELARGVDLPMHRNSPEEWLALSNDEFKVAILGRAKYARNCEERYSWEEVKAYAHSRRVGANA